MRKFFLLAFLCVGIIESWAQDIAYTVASIPEELKENANAVIRDLKVTVNVDSRKLYKVSTRRVVTVLNEKGMQHMDANAGNEVVSISAIFQDANGKVIHKMKRKDFIDVAAAGIAIISDDRYVYADYTPTTFPFTMIFESVERTINTAFLPSLSPINGNSVSCEKQSFEIQALPELGLKFKEYNFDNIVCKRSNLPNGYKYEFENLKPLKYEIYSPSFFDHAPYVLFGLDKFYLEGVEGDAKTWESFSSWMYNNLLPGTEELTPETIQKAKELTKNVSDPIEKAKILYSYMQNKSRYVAIMLGIGGWKPMKAKDVDRLGYGDCKALSNYMRSLLTAVGVSSDYAVIYGGDRRDLKEDFVSMQGNHVVLSIPTDKGRYWMECTSQSDPFGYQGSFTDNRMALLVKPSGGGLVRTTVYKDNLKKTKGDYSINESGHLSGNISIVSNGQNYSKREFLGNKSAKDIDDFYKDDLSLSNMKIAKTQVNVDKNAIQVSENIQLTADRFADVNANRMIFPINAYSRIAFVPTRYRNRVNPFEISSARQFEDEITVKLPEGYSVEAKAEPFKIEDKYGSYVAEISQPNPQTLIYKRKLQIKEGKFPKEEYENFRKFMEGIARADNSKVVLVKN